ncbi:VOC family protein [Nocardia sp. NPDC051030]|uniref:VOC family protein n=1 Tax=Nocardia sp. NPDC051030 TaxID=3155162 RepID=UPI003422AABC
MLTTDFVTGSPSWLDLGSPDVDAAVRFYGAVFGWTFESAGPEAGGYGFFRKEDKTLAGIGPLTEEGASSAWTVYFQTPDAEATAKLVEQAGGTVRVPASDVFDSGRMAAFTDPGGAEFAVWQPSAVKGFELASEPNALCWVELQSGDATAALAFYRSIFGWRAQEMEMPGMKYTVLSTADGDQQDASFGGITPQPTRDAGSVWAAYLAAEDSDATVAKVLENGGSILMPATDVPEIGRIAWFADPFGAWFAILQPLAPQ